MKRFLVCSMAVLLILGMTCVSPAREAFAASKGAKPGAVEVEVIKLTGTVKQVDYEKRTVTLEGAAGKTFTLNAKNARNLDQVKAGDKVNVALIEELAIYVKKADGPAEAGVEQTVALAPKGQMPGGLIAETVEVKADVQDINYKKRTVTLKGPEGNTRTVKVGKQVKNLKEVKKGDQVVLRMTEALALDVVKP